MAERVTFIPTDAHAVDLKHSVPTEENSEYSIVDTLNSAVKKDPYKVINNPDLIRKAAEWNLETVEVFHMRLGLDEVSITQNRSRRQEELEERIDRLHGDEAMRATNGERKKVASRLALVLESTSQIWETLPENERQSIALRIETPIQPTNQVTVVFDAVKR